MSKVYRWLQNIRDCEPKKAHACQNKSKFGGVAAYNQVSATNKVDQRISSPTIEVIQVPKQNRIQRVAIVIAESKLLTLLERRTSVNLNPRWSVTRVLFTKLRTIIEWLFRLFINNPFRHFVVLSKTWKLRATMGGKEALVLGNGPSVSKLDSERINGDVLSGNLDVFAVNYFPGTEFANSITNDFYLVLSDPEHLPNHKNPRTQDLWDYLSKNQKVRLILPTSWARYPGISKVLNSINYFDDSSWQSFSSNISPLFPRGYTSLTAYKALAFAGFLGYKKIYISGIDNTMYKTVRVNHENRLLQDSNHQAGSQGYSDHDLSSVFSGGAGDYFFDLSQAFLDLRLSFSRLEIWNLDRDSMVDAFPKIDKEHKYLQQNNNG